MFFGRDPAFVRSHVVGMEVYRKLGDLHPTALYCHASRGCGENTRQPKGGVVWVPCSAVYSNLLPPCPVCARDTSPATGTQHSWALAIAGYCELHALRPDTQPEIEWLVAYTAWCLEAAVCPTPCVAMAMAAL